MSIAAPLTVAWTGNFAFEWLQDLPEPLRGLPKSHPVTWQRVLLTEFEKNPRLRLHIIALRKNIAQSLSFQRNGVTFHVLKYYGGMRAPSFFWMDTLLIRRIFKKIQPDLVHAWGSESAAAFVSSRLGVPRLVTVQGLLTWYNEITPLSIFQKIEAWTEALSMRRKGMVTTESRFAIEYLRQKFPSVEIEQIEHAPDWLFHRVERRPASDPIRFLTVGELNYRKGTDLLIRALDELTPEIRFEVVLVGSANESFLAPLKAGLSPELRRRIIFKTHLRPAEVADELSKATMVLFPTRADTSPNVIKEAVVAGVPVIASNVGGIPDYIVPDENGLLFSPGSLPEFIEVIRAACRHPLFSRGQVNAASLEKNREYLSPRRMAELFFAAYQRVLKQAK